MANYYPYWQWNNPSPGTGPWNNPPFRENSYTYDTTVLSQPRNGIIWVQGEEGAKAYTVAPGNRVCLFDSENPVVYIKSVDVNGRPLEMEVYDLVKRDPSPVHNTDPSLDMSAYVTRDELDSIIEARTKEIMKRNKHVKKGDDK